METEEIYSLALSTLIVSPFAVEWSEDNHISILTEKGIYILELIASPMSLNPTIKFSRTFVYPPPTIQTEFSIVHEDPIDWRMKRTEVYSLLMEEGIIPRDTQTTEIQPNIIAARWSPRNLIHPNKCLLAILTSGGALMILHRLSMDWYPAHDLYTLRLALIEHESKSTEKSVDADMEFLVTRERAYKLQACSICWSELCDGEYAYLATIYRNGDVTIYRVLRITDFTNISDVQVVGTTNLGEMTRVNVLRWITIQPGKYLIVLGYHDGRICAMEFTEQDDKLVFNDMKVYYESRDRIPITSLTILSQDQRGIRILASKGIFLLLVRLNLDGAFVYIRHTQTDGFGISGITPLLEDEVLIASENGRVVGVTLRDDTFSRTNVKIPLPRSRCRCLDLAHSPSGAIYMTVTSPNSTYDHLITREPSKVQFFAFKTRHEVASLFTRKEPLSMLWDNIELLRVRALKATDVSSVITGLPTDFESLNLRDLRIVMWLTVIREICERKKLIQEIGSIAGEISDAQPLIFVRTACDYLQRILRKSSLTDEQEISVNLLRMYLEVYLAAEEEEPTEILMLVKKILEETAGLTTSRPECCRICGDIIEALPWKASKCLRGHILPRCGITLLQVTTSSSYACPICAQIFHPSLADVYEEIRCPFCDLAALPDMRILDDRGSFLPGNSLSRQKVQSETKEGNADDFLEEKPNSSTNKKMGGCSKRKSVSIKKEINA